VSEAVVAVTPGIGCNVRLGCWVKIVVVQKEGGRSTGGSGGSVAAP